MWADRFSRGLHQSDIRQEMDIDVHAFLKRCKQQLYQKRDDKPCEHIFSRTLYCTRTQVILKATHIYSVTTVLTRSINRS